MIKPGTDQILPDPIYKGNRQSRRRGVVVVGGFFDVATNDSAVGRCHTYTLTSANDSTHTHARHTVGVNQSFETLIEQRRHLQASVRSNIRAEEHSS